MTQSISSPLPQQNSFLQQLLPNLSAGIVAGIFTAVHAVSFAAMIFSGELSEYVAIGIGLAALVSGVDEYFALDIGPYAITQNNLAIFEELLVKDNMYSEYWNDMVNLG